MMEEPEATKNDPFSMMMDNLMGVKPLELSRAYFKVSIWESSEHLLKPCFCLGHSRIPLHVAGLGMWAKQVCIRTNLAVHTKSIYLHTRWGDGTACGLSTLKHSEQPYQRPLIYHLHGILQKYFSFCQSSTAEGWEMPPPQICPVSLAISWWTAGLGVPPPTKEEPHYQIKRSLEDI